MMFYVVLLALWCALEFGHGGYGLGVMAFGRKG